MGISVRQKAFMSTVVAKRFTLAEIARVSGCSKAVVSTVLNGSRGNTVVSQSLRERVEKVAREVGYVPNHASRTLAIGSPQTVGVYICPMQWANVGAEYESAILRGVEVGCQEAGYDMLILNIVGTRGADDCVRKVAGQRIDGLIVVRGRSGVGDLHRLMEACDNVVAADYNEPEPVSLRATSFNNTAAMRLAVEHLVELGHRRIGYIGGGVPQPVPDDLARRAGFIAAMEEFELPLDPSWMICDRQNVDTPISDSPAQTWGWAAVDQALALPGPCPTAYVAWSDSIAVTAMQRFTQRGVRLPDDISLIGVDNSHSCQIVWPGLTSIDHPLGDIGAQAARMLIGRSLERLGLAEGPPLEDRYLFKPRLVVRGTTGPCRADTVSQSSNHKSSSL